SSGLAFIPFGFFRLSEETRLVIQDELHANPDEVSLPIKIPFGFPEEGSDDPLDVRIIAEVAIIVRWRISKFITFLTTIGSRKEARRQMQDSAVAMLTSEFAKITPAVALKNLTSYNNDLKKEIGKRVRLWGVYMENAQIKAINFPDELRNAIQLVPMATAEARATIIGAEAEKEKLRLLGEGSGQAEKAILEGRTAGFKDMAEELDIRSSSILGAETARAITENPGQKTIIPGSSGFSNLVSIAAVMGEVFSETKDTKDSSEEKS
ncbi:hypothetical protein IIB50_00090, partial [Patescibacteria group bacterium]|nr:hypothetical protein [Patescibacteria group bacterium]